MFIKLIYTWLAIAAVCDGQRLQTIRFFPNNNCNPTGQRYEYKDQEVINLISITTLQSYCVVSGAWRVEYEALTSPLDANLTIGDACGTCMVKNPTSRKYNLARRIGGSDLTSPWFTFYTEKNFLGSSTEIRGFTHPEFTFEQTQIFQSFAFSSYSNWTWQIYSLPRFRGNSLCYKPMSGNEINLEKDRSISVGSIRFGCRNGSSSSFKQGGLLLTAIFALAVPTILILL